jgi:hypothetical protein
VALDSSGGQVWIEKVKFHTTLPSDGGSGGVSEGPISELLQVVDEIRSDPARLQALSASLENLYKKLPKELKEGDDAIAPQDVEWLASVLDQVQPMLLRRLMSKKDVA